jgi:GTP cyclohydrolase I
MKLRDIQNEQDSRYIRIDRVGVKNVNYPIIVLDRKHGNQHTIGSIDMFVSLHPEFKGIHMSRFLEILNQYHQIIDIRKFGEILKELKERLSSSWAYIMVRFPYFIEKKAPVSGESSIMQYNCHYEGTINKDNKKDFIVGVKVPVMSVCPCSQAIAKRGAHNQRSLVTVRFRAKKLVWIEEIIEIIEQNSSAPLYPLLKRVDEKYITELSYKNPKFAEDIVRAIGEKLSQHPKIKWFSVESENLESIHSHNAYAAIERWC